MRPHLCKSRAQVEHRQDSLSHRQMAGPGVPFATYISPWSLPSTRFCGEQAGCGRRCRSIRRPVPCVLAAASFAAVSGKRGERTKCAVTRWPSRHALRTLTAKFPERHGAGTKSVRTFRDSDLTSRLCVSICKGRTCCWSGRGPVLTLPWAASCLCRQHLQVPRAQRCRLFLGE